MKIISDEIKLYKGDGNTADTARRTLHRILSDHPALDYADELWEIVKELPFHSKSGKHGKCIDVNCHLVCDAQALIEKIEGKK